jgi:hypothetical protein
MTPTAPDGRVVIRSRVSLAGRVAGADGEIASGGVLNLTAARDAARSRHYETRIRTDGFYFFLDLPAGDYVLEGVDQHGTRLEAKPVSIAPPRGSTLADIVSVNLTAVTPATSSRAPAEAPVPAGRAGAGRVTRAASSALHAARRPKR